MLNLNVLPFMKPSPEIFPLDYTPVPFYSAKIPAVIRSSTRPLGSFQEKIARKIVEADIAHHLEDAYKAHQTTLPWVRAHGYGWDSMHDDSRFQDLVHRMNLPLN
jgi:hypothetical protein